MEEMRGGEAQSAIVPASAISARLIGTAGQPRLTSFEVGVVGARSLAITLVDRAPSSMHGQPHRGHLACRAPYRARRAMPRQGFEERCTKCENTKRTHFASTITAP